MQKRKERKEEKGRRRGIPWPLNGGTKKTRQQHTIPHPKKCRFLLLFPLFPFIARIRNTRKLNPLKQRFKKCNFSSRKKNTFFGRCVKQITRTLVSPLKRNREILVKKIRFLTWPIQEKRINFCAIFWRNCERKKRFLFFWREDIKLFLLYLEVSYQSKGNNCPNRMGNEERPNSHFINNNNKKPLIPLPGPGIEISRQLGSMKEGFFFLIFFCLNSPSFLPHPLSLNNNFHLPCSLTVQTHTRQAREERRLTEFSHIFSTGGENNNKRGGRGRKGGRGARSNNSYLGKRRKKRKKCLFQLSLFRPSLSIWEKTEKDAFISLSFKGMERERESYCLSSTLQVQFFVSAEKKSKDKKK